MITSGPPEKTRKDFPGNDGKPSGREFDNLEPVGRNVWKARLGGKLFLLKTASGNDAMSRHYLHREYEISCNLQYPYIVSVLWFEESTPVGPAIVMEYVEGSTLDAFIAGNPSGSTRRKVLDEILDAVDYLHRKGLLHNDIKPENIMISRIGNHVKIIDFGLSEVESDYMNRRLGGTAGASAPEVLSGDVAAASDASSDIYSLGKIISLLFPSRYGAIRRKCLKSEPARRYKEVMHLQRAIARRDRWGIVSAFALSSLAVLCIALLPYLHDRLEDKEIEDAVQGISREIRERYSLTRDSLLNRDITRWREEGMIISLNFSGWLANYRKEHQNEYPDIPFTIVCDTCYTDIYEDELEILLDIPFSPDGMPLY